MSRTALIENADGFAVDHRQAGIAPATTFVQHQTVFGKPCQPVIQAGLDGHAMAVLRTVGVGEQQKRLAGYIVLGRYMQQAGHTNRLYQCLARRRMFFPSSSKVTGHSHGTTASPIVAHVQHQYARLHFGHLRLSRIAAGRLADVPCLSVILAIDNTGTGNTVRTDELAGKY